MDCHNVFGFGCAYNLRAGRIWEGPIGFFLGCKLDHGFTGTRNVRNDRNERNEPSRALQRIQRHQESRCRRSQGFCRSLLPELLLLKRCTEVSHQRMLRSQREQIFGLIWVDSNLLKIPGNPKSTNH